MDPDVLRFLEYLGWSSNLERTMESKIYMDRYVESEENDFNAPRDDYWKWKVESEQAQKTKA
jgi:hypothetical protein